MVVTRRFAHVTSHGSQRPRVLLVDDHRRILDTVSAMLCDDFDVVGVAADGMQALEIARQVHPDAIVLDVEMPGFNGFQTLQLLEQGGFANTPVVFLSMHDADAIVRNAFRCGARGYVVKTRVGRDLINALDQALLGRFFVPSFSSLLELATGSAHAMHVHEGVESSLDDVAALFDLALRRGDATCVIGTSRFRERLGDRLRARGWDVGGSSGHKRYLAIDTADALNKFMPNGFPDGNRVAESTRELDQYRLAVSEGATSRLTIFGNTAGSLSADGNVRAAIELETLWNEATQGLPFLTICGYSSSCFHEGVPDLWSDACTEHWALSHASDV